MRYIGKAVLELEVEAVNPEVALRKFKLDVEHGTMGIRKTILIEPIFEEKVIHANEADAT